MTAMVSALSQVIGTNNLNTATTTSQPNPLHGNSLLPQTQSLQQQQSQPNIQEQGTLYTYAYTYIFLILYFPLFFYISTRWYICI